MLVSDIQLEVKSLVEDLPLIDDTVRWVNACLADLGIDLDANFPLVSDANSNLSSSGIPTKFHGMVALFCTVKYLEKDGSFQESNIFAQQYDDMKKRFIAAFEVPLQYRDDRLSQQFIAGSGQSTFEITKEGYDPTYGDLKVYVNGSLKDIIVNSDKTFMLTTYTCAANEKVTALWEEHTDFVEPPYNFWTW
jgi:hypothetical protein